MDYSCEEYADRKLNNPELSNLKFLYYVNVFLLVTDILMPQYFGIDIGIDITCTRLANIVLTIYILFNPKIFGVFVKQSIKLSATIPLFLYLFVAGYTMIFRTDINAFMMVFLEILTMYMLFFAIRYVIGVKKSIKIIIFCSYFLGIYGIIEYAAGHSLYLQFLKTVATDVANCYRSGKYRIMGPCGHPLGYGLLLILFIAICCLDYEKNKIYLYKRPILLLLLIVNVFLTGSRSTLAIAFAEMLLILIFSKGNELKKALFFSVAAIIAFGLFVLITYKTSIGQYILMQITSVIDSVFNTQISASFGADTDRLEDSESYREYLPQIFKLDWLNPLIGRGVKRSFGAEITTSDGETIFIQSIDNYYVQQYIKYAYPGLISYVLFILVMVVVMIKNILQKKSALIKCVFIGFICYFFNLWYLDALQTLKYLYIFVALFFAYLSLEEKNKEILHLA